VGDDQNVAVVRRGFECLQAGDAEGMLSTWDEQLIWYAFDANGEPADYHNRDEAMDIFLSGQRLAREHFYDLVDIRAAGPELVVVHARVHFPASAKSEPVEGDYVAVFRVREGRIVTCCDFIDRVTEGYLDKAWS
jgi:ketosteroid isomerase-like protein